MSRPSVYYPASSVSGVGASAAAAANLAAKQAELEGLRVLKEQSARLAGDVQKLGQEVDNLVQGGDAFASVMQSWQGVFRAIQIARADMASMAAAAAGAVAGAGAAGGDAGRAAAAGLAGVDDASVNVSTLVRIPVDTDAVALQQQQEGEDTEVQEAHATA